MTEPVVYLNGEFVPASAAALPLFDAGFVFGATVTEQWRTFQHRLFLRDAHLERLRRSLDLVGIHIRQTADELAVLADEIVRRNSAPLNAEDELGLILFVTPGPHRPYAPPHEAAHGPTVCLHTFVLPWERWAAAMMKGARLMLSSHRQAPAESFDPAIKCRSRMHYYLAELEVRARDARAVPLLLDMAGNVAESSAANVFLVERGTLLTPPPGSILPGISRATVLELASANGIPAREEHFDCERLAAADEVFLTSTPYCVLPVGRFGEAAIGAGTPGPVTQTVQAAWSDRVGLDIVRQVIDGAARQSVRRM